MPTLIVTLRNGETRRLFNESGLSAMEFIRRSGVDEILAICGGACSCATCHVHVDPAYADRLSPMTDDERDLLEWSEHRCATSRLACQIPVSEAVDGLRLTIAPEE